MNHINEVYRMDHEALEAWEEMKKKQWDQAEEAQDPDHEEPEPYDIEMFNYLSS